MEHRIISVEPGSVGEEIGIEKGDVLIRVNGRPVEDVFDWRAWTEEEEFTLLIRKASGEEWEIPVEMDEDEELGLVFENDLMSNYRSCANNCIFCFIDQMPPGMRDTLYFKDDDSRLSFLQGNYITLTNMQEKDVRRIIHYRMEPMNVSIHTTNPELRVKMLKNRRAGEVLSYVDEFYKAGLHMNAQIVLCKDWNDGAELERTLSDLYRYLPVLESVSVVPIGLTRYRDGLTPIAPFSEEDARRVVQTVESWQKRAFNAFKTHYVHASDEFYLLAGLDFPEEGRYDGYLQLENGVGMARLLINEGKKAVRCLKKDGRKYRTTFATGALAAPLLYCVKSALDEKFPGHDNEIVPIRNDFFGETVTVAGLVTGKDLIAQLKGRDLGELLALPNVMFKSGEEVFLDDVTRMDVERALGVKTVILKGGGETLVRALAGCLCEEDFDLTHGKYELPKL